MIADPVEAERIRPAWTGLLERAARQELTHTPDWLLTWWQAYGSAGGRQMRLVLFHAGDRLVGLAPLLIRRHWYGCLPFRRIEFLASGEPETEAVWSNHLAIVAERGAEVEVVHRLVGALFDGMLGSWDEVVLPMMSADTPFPVLLIDAFHAAGLPAEVVATARAPYITLPARWEDYLRDLPRTHRRQIVRSLAAFQKWSGGDGRLMRATTPAELEEGKRILIELHHSRWGQVGESGVFRMADYLRFHDAIMPILLERGVLELVWLSVRGRPVAALYGMAWAGKVYTYQMGRRLDVPRGVRLGGVLLTLAVRAAIEAGRREFDLLADDAPYKLQLANGSRGLVRVRAVRRSLREACRQMGEAGLNVARRMRRRMRGWWK